MPIAIEAIGIGKRFGRFKALESVDAEFRTNEIHAVLGENGAGKSTLAKIIAGHLKPDSGNLCSIEENLDPAIVNQHFMLVPSLTVAQNLVLAHRTNDWLARPARESKEAAELASSLGWSFDPDALVSQLPVGQQQRIEILKALATKSQILVLDEPTAVLSASEVEDLFAVLRRVRDQGKAIILIAHKLDEVLAIADRFTVLRHGKVVGRGQRQNVDAKVLAQWMVGELPTVVSFPEKTPGPVVCEVRNLTVLGDRNEIAVSEVDLSIRAGEILGIGGVDGNGQLELAEAIVGIRSYNGQITLPPSRIGYIPQDRQKDGLALGMDVVENFLIDGSEREFLKKGPFLLVREAGTWSKTLVETFDIRCRSISQVVAGLSGGNQQKIIVGRVLDAQPDLLIAVNPTRGLDVKAANDVLARIQAAAADGSGVLLVSADLDELALIAHRSLFMSRGRFMQRNDAIAYVGGTT